MELGYKKEINLSFTEALEKTRRRLSKENFGIVTEINAKEIFKNKLGVDFENYIILGACHPLTAYKVLEIEKEMGLLLPCNVIVYQENENVIVSAILPSVAIGTANNKELLSLAKEVEQKLKNVIDSI